jgi:nucleoid-associated protein EbfC
VNIGQIAKMAQQMQAQMAQVQAELKITGAQEIRMVEIDPSAVDPEEVDMLQDLVMTAVNDAIARSKQLSEERLASIAGGMGLPGIPGMGGPMTPPPLR